MNARQVFYDWGGVNAWLLKLLNSHRFQPLDNSLLLLDKVGAHSNFPYYFGAIALMGICALLGRRYRGRPVDKAYIKTWVGLLLVLVIGYVAVAGGVHLLKTFFSMPRPFVALPGQVHLIGALPDPSLYYASFPSGHAAFMALIMSAVWPKLHDHGKTLGFLFVALAAYARVALGLHFPADVIYGALLGCMAVVLVRRLVYGILRIPYY